MSSFLEKINNQANDGGVKAAAGADRKPAQNSGSAATGAAAQSASPQYTPGIHTTEHDVEIDRSYGRRSFLRVVSIVLVLAIFGASIFFAVRYFSMVELPKFEGKTITEMRKWCIDNDIFLSENTVYSMETSENYIISQSIAAGTKIYPKKTIEATYSLGPNPKERIAVPDLLSMTAAEIQAWIDQNRLMNTKITDQYSEEEKGKIIGFEFSSASVSETNFTRGDSLAIYVSRGNGGYYGPTMRDFRDKLRAEAESWCSNYGMTAVFTEEMNDTIAEGRIISQSVEPNKAVNYGSLIEFVISLGSGVTIPDFSNIYKEDAAASVKGITVEIKMVYSTTVPYGAFISQSIDAGTKLAKKDVVLTLEYSAGKPFVPNLIGTMDYNLPEMFYELNRKGIMVSYALTYVDSKEPKGSVIYASKNSETVEQYTVIEIKVSRGNLTDDSKPHEPGVTLYRVPSYANVLKENAAAYDKNVPVNIVINYSDTVPYGQLISQSIAPGSYATPDDRVTLIYSAGKPYIGKVEGKNESELPALFYDYKQMGANITYEVVYVDSAEPKGTVIGSSKQNEYINTTEVIQIQVSRG